MRRPIGALIVAALAMMAAAPPPRPPPSVYMTPNHGLLMRVPPRLSYCPLPDGWMGTDHGTHLCPRRPVRCDAPEAPHISVHYELNVAEMTRADGTERSPQTSADLARMDCRGRVTVLRGLRLLGQPAVACEGPAHRIRDVAAVYGLAPRAAGMTRPTTR